MDDELTRENAKRALAAQPFGRLLGARVLAFRPGHAFGPEVLTDQIGVPAARHAEPGRNS